LTDLRRAHALIRTFNTRVAEMIAIASGITAAGVDIAHTGECRKALSQEMAHNA
jgi:hypothetical protein